MHMCACICMYASFSLFIVLKNEGRSMKYDDTAPLHLTHITM